jgi:hypothetical protein
MHISFSSELPLVQAAAGPLRPYNPRLAVDGFHTHKPSVAMIASRTYALRTAVPCSKPFQARKKSLQQIPIAQQQVSLLGARREDKMSSNNKWVSLKRPYQTPDMWREPVGVNLFLVSSYAV